MALTVYNSPTEDQDYRGKRRTIKYNRVLHNFFMFLLFWKFIFMIFIQYTNGGYELEFVI